MFISGNFSNRSFVKTGSIVDYNVELVPMFKFPIILFF